jgi:membrane-associated phospholipid phosphatase
VAIATLHADKSALRLISLLLAAVVAGLAFAVAAGALGHASLDARVAADAHSLGSEHSTLLHFCRDLTWLGAPIVVDIVIALSAVALWWLELRRAAVYLVVARVVAQLISTLLKHAVGRERPHFAHAVAHASGASFPSGHAVGAASTYLAIAIVLMSMTSRSVLRWLALAAAVVTSLVVAATRVLLGVHWMSDVLAGLALGGAVACAATMVIDPRRRRVPIAAGGD